MKRHPRAFWARLVDEVERGGAPDAVARRHGVLVGTLRWWRSMLRHGAKAPTTRLVPIVVAREPAGAVGHVDVAIRSVVLRVATGTDVGYVAALIRAIEPC